MKRRDMSIDEGVMTGICFELALAFPVQLSQQGINRFTVKYGKQVDSELNYANAAQALGEAIMHALACDGKLDNRTKRSTNA